MEPLLHFSVHAPTADYSGHMVSRSPSSNRTFSFSEYGFPIIFLQRLSPGSREQCAVACRGRGFHKGNRWGIGITPASHPMFSPEVHPNLFFRVATEATKRFTTVPVMEIARPSSQGVLRYAH
jgi:hypothetical protein